MDKKEALIQLEIMATNATGRLGEAKSEEEKTLLKKHIEALDMAMDALKDYKPKVGKWIEKDGMWCDNPTFRCSVCGEEYELLKGTPIDVGMNYCPNCGTKMERSKE